MLRPGSEWSWFHCLLPLLTAIRSDGVLSSANGDLVIKPCTDAEVAFYQLCIAQDEPLSLYMPRFMGTLQLSTPEQKQALEQQSTEAAANQTSSPSNVDGTAASLPHSDPGPLKGKKLQTEQAIVLENIAAGFVKPNIMDLKLGSRLWDEDAPPSKRQRLDDVSSKTTSGSLGFRIAGMRVWKPATQEFQVYDKLYGRQFDSQTVRDGFLEYFGKKGAKEDLDEQERGLARRIRQEIEDLQHILENTESRMIGASILMVYEGDEAALQQAIELETSRGAEAKDGQEAEDEDDDGDSLDEDEGPHVCRVVLIDFAHSTIVKGQGRDENVLKGVNGALQIFGSIC